MLNNTQSKQIFESFDVLPPCLTDTSQILSPKTYTRWMYLKSILFLFLFIFVINSQAQIFKKKYNSATYGNHANGGDAFPDPLRYEQSGWLIAPGFTYMLPQPTGFYGNENDSLAPRGNFGLYFELGRYKVFKYPGLFKYMDYGLAFKSLRGSEKISGGNFSNCYISAHFNLNNVMPLTKKTFISNTIGANVDYAFINSSDGQAPSVFVASLHYKFGFGIKVSDRMIVIPSIETPLVNAWEFENGRSSLGFLGARYRPLIVSIRVLFVRPKREYCPPVYAPDLPDGFVPDGMEH